MESTISAFPNIHSGLFWIPQRGEHHNVLASLDLFPNWSAMTGLVKGILKINSAAKCGIREWCTCRALPHTDYWLPPLCRAHSSRSSRSGDRSRLLLTLEKPLEWTEIISQPHCLLIALSLNFVIVPSPLRLAINRGIKSDWGSTT